MYKSPTFVHFYLITFNFISWCSGSAAHQHEIISYSSPSLSVREHLKLRLLKSVDAALVGAAAPPQLST